MIAAPDHDRERPLESRSDAADVLMKAAVLDARVFDAHDEKVVSLFCLFRDGLSGRSVMLANRDVDRRGLVVAALRKRGVLGGRLDGFLDAIFLRLLWFAAGLAAVAAGP